MAIPVATATISTLTDDEILAIAARSSREWSAPLPTLVGANRAGLAAAVARGWRSLAVRELIRDGRLGEPVMETASIASNRVFVRTYLTLSDGSIPASGTFLTAYEAAGSALIELTSGTGIHRFDRTDRQSVRRLIAAAMHEVIDAGIPVSEGWHSSELPPDALCAASADSGTALVLQVRRNTFSVLEAASMSPWALTPPTLDLAIALVLPEFKPALGAVDV